MPVPAPKINEYVAKLNAVIQDGKRLGDIDRYEITKAIDATMRRNPVHALILQALLASVDGDIASSMRSFEEAIKISPRSLEAHSNYAVLLAYGGYPDRASREIRESLDICKEQNNWVPIDNLVTTAIAIGDMDAVADIIHVTGKLGITSSILTDAASLLDVEGDSDEESIAFLNEALSNKKLQLAVSKISDERWAEMKKLAEELSHYVD